MSKILDFLKANKKWVGATFAAGAATAAYLGYDDVAKAIGAVATYFLGAAFHPSDAARQEFKGKAV